MYTYTHTQTNTSKYNEFKRCIFVQYYYLKLNFYYISYVYLFPLCFFFLFLSSSPTKKKYAFESKWFIQVGNFWFSLWHMNLINWFQTLSQKKIRWMRVISNHSFNRFLWIRTKHEKFKNRTEIFHICQQTSY